VALAAPLLRWARRSPHLDDASELAEVVRPLEQLRVARAREARARKAPERSAKKRAPDTQHFSGSKPLLVAGARTSSRQTAMVRPTT
jgi:hypothetical protein